MIIVTGGAGFIGSNLVHRLNRLGYSNILVVDNLTCGSKFKNIVDCKILDYVDKDDFLINLKNKRDFGEKIEVIFHQGACSKTTETNGSYMLRNNYEYSKLLLEYCSNERIPLIYASSASVYGKNKDFQEKSENESPLNVYGYSKLLFDQYVRRVLPKIQSQVVGLRYFNVYGPNEQHKEAMASVMWHFSKQLLTDGKIKLFSGNDGYGDGEQLRDFVFVDDVIDVNLWFWKNKGANGIYNVGTGKAVSFNDVGKQILELHGRGLIEYIPFPEQLKGSYQSFTQANLELLRKSGCDVNFRDITKGIRDYFNR